MLNGGSVSEKVVAVVTVNALCLDLLAVYDNAAVLYLNSSCADGESDVLVSAVESESIEVGFFVRPELCPFGELSAPIPASFRFRLTTDTLAFD